MAITISGENNNDKILASDGVIDQISGINIVGVITATTFTINTSTTKTTTTTMTTAAATTATGRKLLIYAKTAL